MFLKYWGMLLEFLELLNMFLIINDLKEGAKTTS